MCLVFTRRSGSNAVIDFKKYDVLSFDCYGTLIDWESGILAGLRPILSAHHIRLDEEQLLKLFAETESAIEQGEYRSYKEVLRRVVEQMSERLGFTASVSELSCLVDSLGTWMPFPDTVSALEMLKRKYRLAIISNTDDDLFALTAKHLRVDFDWIITAEQTRSYKPSLNNFRFAVERIGGPPKRLLHVAQSLYHDIVPARALGLSTVWVNRRKSTRGFGATPPAHSQADIEVPDLQGLVSMINSIS